MRTTKTIASVAGADIKISDIELGYKLSETNRSIQLFIKGMDGGECAVLVKPIDAEDWFVFEPIVTEQDLVMIPAQNLCFDEILIQFLSLGGAADPACTITSFVKTW